LCHQLAHETGLLDRQRRSFVVAARKAESHAENERAAEEPSSHVRVLLPVGRYVQNNDIQSAKKIAW
jgi:hypothetical protein